MGAIPSLTERQDRLASIDGAMPRLADIPAGCAFHPRCPWASDDCRTQRPPLVAQDAAAVACWREAELSLSPRMAAHG
jgi:peptide/nickel transport system ATP-binding protein